jgi:hypothetical protein
MGYLVRQQAGPLVNVRGSRMPPALGLPGVCQSTLAPAANCWQLASAGREANVETNLVCRVLAMMQIDRTPVSAQQVVANGARRVSPANQGEHQEYIGSIFLPRQSLQNKQSFHN